jgi:pimeloyl-ACP methyl ester carboxylesterase/DNA-binding CsgD family transcriptional regulator
VVGTGPPVVFSPGWSSTLETLLIPESSFLGIIEQLSTRNTIITYDKRGMGLSDRDWTVSTTESLLFDLEAAVGHAEVGRFALWGDSQGAPPAMVYAAEHPDEVERLLLTGAFANGSTLATQEMQQAFPALVRANWGLASRTLASLFIPGDYDPAAAERLATRQRMASTPEVAANLLEVIYAVDVREFLPRIVAPTLALHARGDRAIPFHAGQEVASLIPSCRFVPFDTANHPVFRGDEGVRAVRLALEFLTDELADEDLEPQGAEPGRSTYPDALSEREVEVLGLVAAGMTNAEIAAQLVIAPATAARHVSNILNKIGLSNRTQAASYATKHGLDRG